MTEKKILLNSSTDPFILFKEWFEEASKKEINDPNAMNLSTLSSDYKPSSRMVLLKGFDKKGFVFYTNTQSKKGVSIQNNRNVALNFHWKSLLKQVRIEGNANQVSDEEADEYFETRPLESRIGAWASNQSAQLIDRERLNENIQHYKEKFKDKKIQRPSHWSGFRVEPELIEFWQDMPFRLHDRLEYKKINNDWIVRKLFP
jgi:pyridoxamine 5'-phosphate oxidase